MFKTYKHQAIHKETFRAANETNEYFRWEDAVETIKNESYLFCFVQLGIKMKGLKELVVCEIRFVEFKKDWLIPVAYGLVKTPVNFGKTRKEKFPQTLREFFQSEWFVEIEEEDASYTFHHKLRFEDPAYHREEGQFHWYPEDDFHESFFSVRAVSFDHYLPLVSLNCYPKYENKERIVYQELMYCQDAIYSNLLGGREAIWSENQIQVRKFAQPSETADEEVSWMSLSDLVGEYVYLKETKQVFKKLYTYHLNEPLRLFPQSKEYLTSGLIQTLANNPLTWNEFARLNNLSPTQSKVGRLAIDGYELTVLTQRLQEDDLQTLAVGDYVQINRDNAFFGWVSDVVDNSTGKYLISFEKNRYLSKQDERHISSLTKTDWPSQELCETMVFVEEFGFGILKQQGYTHSQIRFWEVSSGSNPINMNYSTFEIGIPNKDLLILENQEKWKDHWEQFLTYSDYNTLLFDCIQTEPQLIPVMSWWNHCDFFSIVSWNKQIISFIFIIHSLIRAKQFESLYQMMWICSVPSRKVETIQCGQSLASVVQKIEVFFEYLLKESEWKGEFKSFEK